MGFGEYLKRELQYRGILVRELAHATGIPKHTLDKYLLTNGATPSADNAVAIAQALGVTVEYLVTGRENSHREVSRQSLSPEMRSIVAYIAPLPREKREVVEKMVAELVNILQKPIADELVALTPLQKVFIRLFR